jgi:hypothetical protein
MNHDQWKTDLHDGVDMAHKTLSPTAVTITEATRLHKSIDATPDPERMKDDTLFRTDGVCGANKAERINGIAESFAALNGGRDGG